MLLKLEGNRKINFKEALKDSEFEWALALKSKGTPQVRKETKKEAIVDMVGAAIVASMAVVMMYTKPFNHLNAVCRALFESFIFGLLDTNLVLYNLARKFVRAEAFVAWKFLRPWIWPQRGLSTIVVLKR